MQADVLMGRHKNDVYLNVDDTVFEFGNGMLTFRQDILTPLQQLPTIQSDIYTSYSPYYVQSSAPSSPYIGWLWYDTTTNKLYKYSGTDWIEINWQEIVKATTEWQSGKLRIGLDGILEIADGQATPVWYDCYPLIGAKQMHLQDTSIKYYLPIGSSAKITGGNVIPIVYNTLLYTSFMIVFDSKLRLYSSGVTSRTTLGSTISMPLGTGTMASATYSFTYHLISDEQYNQGLTIYTVRQVLSSSTMLVVGTNWAAKYRGTKADKVSTDYYIGTTADTIETIIIKRKG